MTDSEYNNTTDSGQELNNGFNRPWYSDAHFTPADDSTVPPKYYVPNQRTQNQTQEKKQELYEKNPGKPKSEKHGIGIVGIICLCAIFSALGGFAGAFLMKQADEQKYAELEDRISGLEPAVAAAVSQMDRLEVAQVIDNEIEEIEEISPSDIYETACNQVVGITTEVTYSNMFGMVSSSAVTGTGFFISEDGYVVTNYHVIESEGSRDARVSVITHDGSTYDAEIIGTEPDNDIAVLKINGIGFSPVKIGNSDDIRVGDSAFAVGNPLGELEFTMTSGTVSALDRLISPDSTSVPVNMFQIDAAVNSGNSGGPVYDKLGEVIGIVTAKYSSNGVEGIGFAIPINDATKIIDELVTNGYVTGKAFLGVYYDENSNSVYNRYYRELWNSPKGVLVMKVESKSSADKAGIHSYDIITSIDDVPIESCTDLITEIKKHSAGDTVTMQIFRVGDDEAGNSMEFNVTFDESKPNTVYGGMSVA